MAATIKGCIASMNLRQLFLVQWNKKEQIDHFIVRSLCVYLSMLIAFQFIFNGMTFFQTDYKLLKNNKYVSFFPLFLSIFHKLLCI